MKLELSTSVQLGLEEYFKANQIAWNQKVCFDIASDYYDIAGFKSGKNSLYPLDIQLLGNVKGKRILHLQSYLGLDSISLSKMGAEVVAIDFCQNAIDFSQNLSKELSTDIKFICSNVFDINKLNLGQFDIIYMSYGAICWLPNINKLIKKTKQFLKPKGKFILIDFHPLAISFDLLREESIKYSYFNQKNNPIEIYRKGTYADVNASIETTEFNWNHSLDEIIGSFTENGLELKYFKEYPFLPMNGFPNLELGNDGYYHVINANDKYPLLFSLIAKNSND
jgi:2-polyprenyl-3-methyl-5-hydroxy-6-metoxy-1,4-benzoquinol methylase